VLLDTFAVGLLQLKVYAKYVLGGETTYTFNWGTSRWSTLASTYFTGRAQDLDLSTLVRSGTTGSGTSITSRSVTAATGDDLAWGVDCHEYNGGETHAPPTSFTEVYDNEAGDAAYRANVASGTQTASGATISSSQNFAVELIALPAAGGGGSNFTQTPTDNEGVSDAAALSQAKATSDPEGLTDSTATAQGKSSTDQLGLSDTATPSLGYSQSKTDGLGVADTASVSVGRASASTDLVGVTDAAVLEKSLTQAPADAVGVADAASLVATYSQTPADTVALADSAALAINRAANATDPVGVTDSADVQLASVGGLSPSDPVGLTDSTRLDRAAATTDPVGVTDSATVQLAGAGAVNATDSENLTDAAVLSRQKSAADVEGITDSVSLIITRDLGDTVGLSDIAALAAAFARVLADVNGLTDEASVDLNPTEIVIPDEVEATPRPYISTANLGSNMSTATARAYESTATARSLE
jgi:hypothetical protein